MESAKKSDSDQRGPSSEFRVCRRTHIVPTDSGPWTFEKKVPILGPRRPDLRPISESRRPQTNYNGMHIGLDGEKTWNFS